jgi:hypothetical protein
LIVVVAYVLWTLFTPRFRTPPAFPTPTPTPAGVEYERASTFWNKTELPALSEFSRSVPAINTTCKGALSPTCLAAITATDQKLQSAITIINQGDIPACIATHVARYKGDLLSMDGGLQIALNGYKAGDNQQVAQGLLQFRDNAQNVSADAAAVTNDVKVLCN